MQTKRKVQPPRLLMWPVFAATLIALIVGVGIGSIVLNTDAQDTPTPDEPLVVAQTATNTTCETWTQRARTQPTREQAQANDTETRGVTAIDDAPEVGSGLYIPSDEEEAEFAAEADEALALGGAADDAAAPPPSSSRAEDGIESEPLPLATSAPATRPLPEDGDFDTSESSLPPEPQPSEPLRAGEIDDNATWDDYQAYRTLYFTTHSENSVIDVDISDRQIIQVLDEAGNTVLGACVEVYNGESLVHRSRTLATGLTLFFPNANEFSRYVQEFTVVAFKGDARAETTLNREAITGTTELTLPMTQQLATQLDVMFVLDATGSMADELRQLQDNILTISSQIDALEGNVDVRYSMVAYRDRGDQYVTRLFDFTDDVQEFQANLNSITAGGGGDTPESMNQALDEALNEVAWRGENTIKLMFLVADAEPHLDYQLDVPYVESMDAALTRGIKIHAIAGSDTSDPAEYVMRQLAQHTLGKFIFLTYEDGVAGTPGDERPDLEVGDPRDEQGVGDYSVSQLDELVLRLITDEIAALTGQ